MTEHQQRIERLLLAALAANRARCCELTEAHLDVEDERDTVYFGERRPAYRPPPRSKVRLVVDFEPPFLTEGADMSNDRPATRTLPSGPVDAEFIENEVR